MRVLRWKKVMTTVHVFLSYPPPHASPAHARSFEQISLLHTPSSMRTPTHSRRSLSPTDPSTSCVNTPGVLSCRVARQAPGCTIR
jgi:hypothetical protein